MTNHNPLPYFSPLLPWQSKAWLQTTGQFYTGKLPHGLLASGMVGIGKRAFVWRFVAWLLCTHKNSDGACGVCESCTWLRAGTHPDLMVLPKEEGAILIDEVREAQDYSHIKGQGVRLIVFDNADGLTLGASNALLKTLEEPRAGVHLILISDNPSRLLPTIKSRVQTLPLTQIDHDVAFSYVADKLGDANLAKLTLDLADGAVLQAVALPKVVWFAHRALWIRTYLALQTGQRLPIAASDYWQTLMDFANFAILTRLMLAEVMRVALGLPSQHSDIDVAGLVADFRIDTMLVWRCLKKLDELSLALGQNVQEKVVYDQMFGELANRQC